jgi:hypothetical protein
MDGQHHALAAALLGKRPSTHCIAGWVAPGPVWTGRENLAPAGIRSLDRPVPSESLYRLSYPGQTLYLLQQLGFIRISVRVMLSLYSILQSATLESFLSYVGFYSEPDESSTCQS